ncbi:MAG: NUDIX domain-containing protein [Deltaproteobacteria bacterium]|nr:NUDIX domain-containing protein [Deltaproteobacteria bacterium]
MTAAEELVDIVDRSDRVVGRVTRAEMRRRNLLHRTVYIVVRNGRRDFFVHRRTTTKDVYPGHWDVTVGGVVAADEGYEAAARRELAEEVGIHDAALESLFDVRFADPSTRLLGRAFLVHHDGDVTLQADEVAWGAFVPRTEVERIVREEPCCPDGVQVLRRYLASLATTS